MIRFQHLNHSRPPAGEAHPCRRVALLGILCGILLLLGGETAARADIAATVTELAAFPDRSTGTAGCRAAADHIRGELAALGFSPHSQRFSLPVRRHGGSRLILPAMGASLPVHPLLANAISPGTIPPSGLEGPVIYAGTGELEAFNHQPVEGAIVLMEMESGKNWQNAANLGARALIYLDRGAGGNDRFQDKMELSPIRFPRFWLPREAAKALFGEVAAPRGTGGLPARARLVSDIRWEETIAENIYALIPGTDPDLQGELLVVEAFYDSAAWVAGRAPGAEEALGIATLLEAARFLREHPPRRPVLLAATSGHGQVLAGMREFIYALHEEPEALEGMTETLARAMAASDRSLAALAAAKFAGPHLVPPQEESLRDAFRQALSDQIKTEVDRISRRLMQLRLQEDRAAAEASIQALARERFLLRRLGWRKDYDALDPGERSALKALIPQAVKAHQDRRQDAGTRLALHQSALDLRELAAGREIAAMVSLHLSSHGSGLGAFHQGFLYPLNPEINRTAAYARIDQVLRESARESDFPLRDTLRPSLTRTFASHFRDRPFLGGEVGALAGFPGFSLVTVEDARPRWGTPYDVPAAIDWEQARRQSRLVCRLLGGLAAAPRLTTGSSIRDGFCVLTGRANFLRHGELFPDQPAPDTTLLVFQGPARYHARVDSRGVFCLKGLADKRHVMHKAILEGYRFDPETGETVWAIDKETTGKDAYRVKMRRNRMETDLIMFNCRQITLFELLEPRNFNYLTRMELIDARREAQPTHYWYSRIDTRQSVIASVFLEPGTRLKLTLSDSLLNKKMILTHATAAAPTGTGYLVDQWPVIPHTGFRAARDMWRLLAPRIRNLESHGIHNQLIRDLQEEGTRALQGARSALEKREYDRFEAESLRSWALAARVYGHVEQTQRDVLFGVLFYIALFVPFAFCMERFLFSFTDIHKRIIAFGGILLAVILVIRAVHPAFALAYSPTVVILAFFIMGLSFLVTLIIFFRFEREMARLQRQANHLDAAGISRWKAFAAAFFLGVGNLRRRRLRTVLTCLTLTILTFTIMGFTAVKTTRHYTRVFYRESAPYQGFLLKNGGWRNLPPEAVEMIGAAFGRENAAPRIWLETEDRTRPVHVPVARGEKSARAEGLIGLSPGEPAVSGIDRVLVAGRWFDGSHERSVLLPRRLALRLGIDPGRLEGAAVRLWGERFRVAGIFDGEKLQAFTDLDGEPLTPVTFPSEASAAMTEVEMEALESGEDVDVFQSRYQHVRGDLTVIVPAGTLLAAGGSLKSLAIRAPDGVPAAGMARNLVDRFGLLLFAGESGGTYLYNAGDTLDYSGVPNVLIPMAISVFIVLNTMIGSVYERKREIGIYTSVGLAPSHVSFLFIAESLAFAVISVVFGYLLAQSSAALLAGTAFWSGITANYSSFAGVAAMLLVILVVLVSAVYPSRVAAAIAIPDVKRSFRLPAAEGGTLELTMPVLLQYRELKGVGGFIHAFFQGHREVSHGRFTTGDLAMGYICSDLKDAARGGCGCRPPDCPRGACLHLTTRVWLAPFDFGIMQTVDLTFCPHPIDPAFLEIRVRLTREAGEVNPWRRINQAFIHDLRRQLLLWRSLDPETQADFRREMEALEQACEEGDAAPPAGAPSTVREA